MRRTLFPVLAFALILAGCGSPASSPAPGQVGGTQSSNASGSLIIEPDYGIGPYLMVIDKAKHTIDVNTYLLTDPKLVLTLQKKARTGVSVRVMVAGNPYGDSEAPAVERDEFTGTNIQFKLAPPQFEGQYTYDHAKYLVVDAAGPDREALLGSSNMDKAGLSGTNSVYPGATRNREYDYDATDPAVVANLEAIFDADWNGQPVHLNNPNPLVISPGSESQLVSLIQGAKQTLYIESEELGNDRPVLDAISAAARRGVQVEVVLPTDVSAGNRRNAEKVSRAGAQVRYLSDPYPHAKLIIADDRAFLGSQNISVSSLDRNREVGILVAGNLVGQVEQYFQRDYVTAGHS